MNCLSNSMHFSCNENFLYNNIYLLLPDGHIKVKLSNMVKMLFILNLCQLQVSQKFCVCVHTKYTHKICIITLVQEPGEVGKHVKLLQNNNFFNEIYWKVWLRKIDCGLLESEMWVRDSLIQLSHHLLSTCDNTDREPIG